jgi:hypothetical protein
MIDRTQTSKDLKPMDPLVIPIVGMLIPIIIVPTALGIKHARFLREVEHAERMRAMELGRTLPEDESWDESWTFASVAVIIGAGVPIGAMLIAFMASKSLPNVGGKIESIWMTTMIIGLAGVISGSVLGGQLFSKRNQPTQVASQDEKPAYDPEEFDVVGRRG